MLTHDFLHDPVARTATMADAEFTKYTDICHRQHGPTDPTLVKRIEETFKNLATADLVNDERISKLWDFMEPKLSENEGLARFTLESGGVESEFFFPWLINVFRSPARALEMAYGAGENLHGEWRTDILETEDPIVHFVRNDPTFVYNRERQLHTAELATIVKDMALWGNYQSKIVDFGAGVLAWVRHHGYELEPNLQLIYAFDRDPSIRPEDWFDRELSDGGARRKLTDIGVYYKHGDLLAQVRNPDCKEAHLIAMGGVASYLPPKALVQSVMLPIHDLLVENGVFFFDLQLKCPYLERSMKLWDWPEMNLYRDAPAAITAIEQIRSDLWETGHKFSAEYAVDTYNHSPSAVMITFTKI